MNGWIDSHCHMDIEPLASTYNDNLDIYQSSNIRYVIVPGVSPKKITDIVDMVELNNCAEKVECGITRPIFKFAVGLHPFEVKDDYESSMSAIVEHMQLFENHPDLIAVGECGLDRMILPKGESFKFNPGGGRQLYVFEQHILLAQQYNLPLIIHSRGANDECCALLRRSRFRQGGVAHGFSGSWQQAQNWLDIGFKIGIGGNISHSRAQKLRSIVSRLPDDGWVLESDAPDMTPSFCQPAMNSPLMIPLTAQLLAQFRGTDITTIQSQSVQNTMEVFQF